MRSLFLVLTAIGFVIFADNSIAEDDLAKSAEAGKPVDRSTLKKIYSGNTWKWNDTGAAYFSQGNFFTSAEENGGFGRGLWFIRSKGRLCFKATWYTAKTKKTGKGETCLVHRTDDQGRILQKPENDGNWWVFKQSPSVDGDGFSKIFKGDQVKVQLKKNMLEKKRAFQ